jgi:hypothetical protein
MPPIFESTTPAEMGSRARLIAAILTQAGIPVRSILDAGCGLGLLRKPFAEVLPKARYHGLEASDYLCSRYGWTQGSVVDHRPDKPCDLLVCYDVLQYLDDRAAARAIANFRRMTRAALYVSALTRGLARELRSLQDGSRRASSCGRLVPPSAAAAFQLPGIRSLAARRRHRPTLGHGADGGLRTRAGCYRLACIQSTSAA